MSDLVEDYLRAVRSALDADPEEKRQIVRELRTHIHDRVDDLTEVEPERSRRDHVRRVLNELGSPRDLALAYGPGDEVRLERRDGEVLLRFGQAMGRGAGKLLKGVAIAAGVLLVLALAVGVWAWYEVRPELEAYAEGYAPYPVYDYDRSCIDTVCSESGSRDTFYVHGNARDVRMDLDVHFDDEHLGSVMITVRDPDGDQRFQRTYRAGDGDAEHRDITWGPEKGDWSITYDYTAFRGSVDVDIFTVGAPTTR